MDPTAYLRLAAEADDDVRASEGFIQRRMRYPDPHNVIGQQRAYAEERRRDALRHRRAACTISREQVLAPAVASAPRPRGAGRPRAAATRSTSRSGDSGDDGSGSSSDDGPAAPRRPLNGGTA
jgi:hypothetical protein